MRASARGPLWIKSLLPALVPGAALIFLLQGSPGSIGTSAWVEVVPWVPSLGVSAAFRLDGLSLLMSVLVLGIGTLVFAYAGRYLADDPRQARFFAILFAFAGAMLGLVLADDAITLFVFWELTSITSFLLIGHDHESAASRRAAMQGLVVTVSGGLAMLAGLIVLADIAGSYRISDWATSRETIQAHPRYTLALALIALGCFTKSAQVPFHSWLANAMAAPTPVSAYLHSATMVKAGVYLLARLHPSLGGSEAWFWLLAPIGAVTMVTGAWLAYRTSVIKQVLAYTTIMALGTLVLLLGLGQPAAAVTYLLAHALYKGSLFLVAGILDHEAGAKDLREVSGQRRALPLTAIAAALAALSLAGLPPLFGFIAKEALLESGLHAVWAGVWVASAVIAAMAVVAMALTLALRPFLGASHAPSASVHEAPLALLAGPLFLALAGLLLGLMPGLAENALLLAAAEAAGAPAGPLKLALWHGLTPGLAFSALSIAAGIGLFVLWPRLQPALARWTWIETLGPDRGYDRLCSGLLSFARAFTRRMQSGSLRQYVLTLLSMTLLVTGGTLLLRAGHLMVMPFEALPTPWVPLLVALVTGVAAVSALWQRSALAAVLVVGASGYGLALLFMWYSAPDLAITQLLIETLTAILLVLVLSRLPAFRDLSSGLERLRDAAVAGAFGALIVGLLWMVLDGREHASIAAWFLERSLSEGQGRNVVNVIIVDFRALDTLGEIFVMGLAAVGVWAMMNRRIPPREP